tara:strand:- start:734 stop:1366 length:633 start_codon:yes stop_codon:yes gene_type:complete
MAFSSLRTTTSNFEATPAPPVTQSQLIRGILNTTTSIQGGGAHGLSVYWSTVNGDHGVTDWNSIVARGQALGADTSVWNISNLPDNDKFFGWLRWASNDPGASNQSQGINIAWTGSPPWDPIPVTILECRSYLAPAGIWELSWGHDKNSSTYQTTATNLWNDSSTYTSNYGTHGLRHAFGNWEPYWNANAASTYGYNTCDFILDIEHPPL